MSDCEQALTALHQYLDGELRPNVQAGISSHLHECPDCSQAYDFHGELRHVIANRAREASLPEAFWERLQSRVETELGDEFQLIRDSFASAMQNVQSGLLHHPKPVFGGVSNFEQGTFEQAAFDQPSPFEQPSPFNRPSPFGRQG